MFRKKNPSLLLFLQELFQSVDRHHTGKISVDSLREILSTTAGLDLKSDDGKFSEMILAMGMVNIENDINI